MAVTAPTSPAQAQTQAIDHYFSICLFLMLATGFATLAGTGKLDPLSVILVTLALLLRCALFISGRNFIIPERWTTAFTLAYVLFYGLDYLLLSRAFVTATVHLVLFNVIVKIFSVHRERDNVYLATLSFLMVLAAAVLTIDTLFLASFCLFLLLSIATFTSMEIRRSLKAAGEAGGVAGSGKIPFSGSLSRTSLVLLLGTIVCAGLIFFLLPRTAGGYLSGPIAKDSLSTGFSDDVTLGAIGLIQQSNEVVMHVQFAPGTAVPAPNDMRWRGMSLALFDGRRWTNPHGKMTVLTSHPGVGFMLPHPASMQLPAKERYEYRVIMEPTTTNLFFVMPRAETINGDYRSLGVNYGDAIESMDRDKPIGAYSATSVVPLLSETNLSHETTLYPPDVAFAYLQLPKLDQRIGRLARDITAGQTSNYKKARALEKYLQEHYAYTLQLADPGSEEPLSFFLFTHRQGHCEYFASSMTIMLRTLGIPSRVVNGFRGGQWNDINGSYIVRQRDAHSWVEAYLPPYGWVTFDPTPSSPGLPVNRWSRLLLYMDALRVFWREWVINFDFSRQNTLNHQIGNQTRSLSQRLSAWYHRKQDSVQHRLRRWQLQMLRAPLPWAMRILLILILVSFALWAPRLYRSARSFELLRHPRLKPSHAATLWYQKLLKRLARAGYRKQDSQTAEEFAASIETAKLQTPVKEFTKRYEQARFADSADDAAKLEGLFHEIETTLKK